MGDQNFKPAWWLPSPHLQTLWPAFFKKRHSLDLIPEQVELDDGDFVDLCWSKKTSDRTVLVLHGLEGSLDSHYANGIMYQLERSGYKAVFMYFRGCSGRINRLPRAYHSGDTGDIEAVVEHIKNKTGHYPYGIVGYSLGANALLKWLGETGGNNPIQKAVAVSVPFTLHDAAKRLEKGVSKIYREHLLSSLKTTYIEKFKQITSPLDVEVKQLKSFWEYDDKVTAPLHGFAGAKDYYERSSSRQYLKDIQVPTRIIHALDDPFMYRTTVPDEKELSRFINFLPVKHGGHVGFVSGNTPFSAYSWSEKKVIEFLDNRNVT
ncbi:MAG: hydrolase [Gammaproteobacteria bacterium]|nr:hydrolase [Gammaproteobacteria bacterium]